MRPPRRPPPRSRPGGSRPVEPDTNGPTGPAAATPPEGDFPVEYVSIHGHRVGYRRGGSGPVLLLLHGIAGSSQTWIPAMELLQEDYTVVAPDFLGHGRSAKPTGDYSLGNFASMMRDLLQVLGIDRATIVGQSFGGGVAMQFAYQFPERCERLVLVDAGGLGPRGQLDPPPGDPAGRRVRDAGPLPLVRARGGATPSPGSPSTGASGTRRRSRSGGPTARSPTPRAAWPSCVPCGRSSTRRDRR